MFTSDRIHLRKMNEDDFHIYHNWRSNIEVMQYTNPELDVYSLRETEQFIKSICNSNTTKNYIIELNESDKPIGIASLVHMDLKNRNAECIIDIGHQSYWGSGYGKEVMNILLDYSFSEMNLHKLYLRVFSFNERAIKLYESLGFLKEGEQKEHIFRNGKWHGIITMAIFQSTYIRQR
ncbi:GNAT family N-acetyltransferase [Halobacillus sp. A1]|uniref:GNAT family N-acetyltransferase n=1 Tax=Halobacillus sp. A1 TaxID=2880262 RepID=UPI0020A6AF7D|nr:GNAT family protein [Halobacillus sp. A1]MCP3030799.1 GNAT family N-acetyltransferase [Halobacillus sp. A1]